MKATEFSAARAALGVSQKEMGERLGGYAKRTVQSWEAGARKIPPAVTMLTEILLTTNSKKGF